MKYLLALLANLLCLASLFAQEDELRLVSSRYSVVIDQKGFSSIQPVYAHKGSTLAADSGILYEDAIKRQYFEAFNNIVITQPNGTTIFADKLHYDATSQVATLTNNVRMVSPNSILTTNHLIYKMREKIGTYTGGGRIISKGDTITSLNAYYFENTQDAYFRKKVVVRTPDVKIYTDTMRYNSAQRMTYFFGPTNIKGNKQENLYTEKGNYNTATGIANFSKNNLYTEGSRFLKGDSLHYNRSNGMGKAFKNVVFVDTADKFYAYGGYGLYDQQEESITMTDKPLITMVVKSDSTSSASSDSTATDSTEVLKSKEKVVKKDKAKDKKEPKISKADTKAPLSSNSDSTSTVPPREATKVDSAYMTADTLYSRLILLKEYKPLLFKLDRSGGELDLEQDDMDYGDEEDLGIDSTDTSGLDSASTDSISLDSTKLEIPLKKVKDAVKTITTGKKAETHKPAKVSVDTATSPRSGIVKTMRQDSILRQRAVVPRIAEADSIINKALITAHTPDTTVKDTANPAYLDTARTRIIKAYHNVRMFKSDLQAVSDSLYYGMADSMFRFMGRPMIWSQGSQISSDTIYMQIRNQRMDNALLIANAFMVNAVLDTLKFNQLKGRKITAFFANNSIDRMFVDGNAENLVFSENDKTKTITEMFHDRGARISIRMENKKIIDYITIRKVDQKVYPFKLVTQENETLPGFVWRPEDRPKSKEDMMNRKREIARPDDMKDGGKDSTDNGQQQKDLKNLVPDSTKNKAVQQDEQLELSNDSVKTEPSQTLKVDSVQNTPILKNEKLDLNKDSIGSSPIEKMKIDSTQRSSENIPLLPAKKEEQKLDGNKEILLPKKGSKAKAAIN